MYLLAKIQHCRLSWCKSECYSFMLSFKGISFVISCGQADEHDVIQHTRISFSQHPVLSHWNCVSLQQKHTHA